MDGTAIFPLGQLFDCICEQVTGQWDAQKKTILHILALSVFAGIFVKFAGTIGDGDLGETGFFVCISSFVFTRAFGIFRCVCRGGESTGKSDWLYESFDSFFFAYPLLWRENAEFACLL